MSKPQRSTGWWIVVAYTVIVVITILLFLIQSFVHI